MSSTDGAQEMVSALAMLSAPGSQPDAILHALETCTHRVIGHPHRLQRLEAVEERAGEGRQVAVLPQRVLALLQAGHQRPRAASQHCIVWYSSDCSLQFTEFTVFYRDRWMKSTPVPAARLDTRLRKDRNFGPACAALRAGSCGGLLTVTDMRIHL